MSSEAVRAKDSTPHYRPKSNAQNVPPGHKRTEVGVIPDDWSTRSLGEIGHCLIGLTYEPSNVRPDGLLVLRASNIGDGGLQFGDDVFVDVDVPERLLVRPDDLIICVRNGSRRLIGKCTLLDSRAEGMTFGAFMSVFRSDDNHFVAYCFQSHIIKRQIRQHLGATINQITNKSLNSFEVPFPPLPERHAVAEALSDVDALLDGLDRLIAKKQHLKQATMQQLLTGQTRLPEFDDEWETKRVGEIGTTYGGLTGKTKADFGVGHARYVTFLNVLANVVIDAHQYEPVRVEPGERQNPVRRGDILFNGTSETPDDLAMAAVAWRDVDNLFLNSFCFGFRVHNPNEHLPLFLAYYFRGSTGRHIMHALAQGATRYNMSKRQFMALALSLPQHDEQKAIATVLSDMDAENAALEARRDKTQDLKQAMMQELLTGKTRLVQQEVTHV